ncbi:methyl-accepting chemotaxis protein [Rhizobium deserti]|nr:methyl-accepting chemotaxis protein [Rhizobium deserti]
MLQKQQSLSFRLVTAIVAEAAVLAALLIVLSPPLTGPQLMMAMVILAAVTLGFAVLVKRLLASSESFPLHGFDNAATTAVPHPEPAPDHLYLPSAAPQQSSHLNLVHFANSDEVMEGLIGKTDENHHENSGDEREQAEELKTVVAALDVGLRRFASGDLTARIEAPLPAEFEGLRSDFNHSLEGMEEVLDDIGSSAATLHGCQADLQADIKALMQSAASQTAEIARTATETAVLSETVRARQAQAGYTASAGYSALLDLPRARQTVDGVASAMQALATSSAKTASLNEEIMNIAFKANLLAMNLKLQAGKTGQAGDDMHAAGDEFRHLAEQMAEAAKANAHLSRTTSQAATLGVGAADKVSGEFDAMAVYLKAIHEKAAGMAENAGKEKAALDSLRSTMMKLARTSREHAMTMETLRTRTDVISREVAFVDRHASRFIPIRTIQPGSIFKPQPQGGPKPGAHLRLVKS